MIKLTNNTMNTSVFIIITVWSFYAHQVFSLKSHKLDQLVPNYIFMNSVRKVLPAQRMYGKHQEYYPAYLKYLLLHLDSEGYKFPAFFDQSNPISQSYIKWSISTKNNKRLAAFMVCH